MHAAIPASWGGTIWHPLPQYTLYPLYSFGLCDAVTMMPAAAPFSATHVARSGVGTIRAKRCTGTPRATQTEAASRANSSERCRPSKPMATPPAASCSGHVRSR